MRAGAVRGTALAVAAGLALTLATPLPAFAYDGMALSDVPPLPLTAARWRSIGPFRAGRSTAVAGSAARPLEYYQGTSGGGVFKTTNGGFSWFPVSDDAFGGTVGAIAVSESNPDLVVVGTGERSLRGDVSPGDGLYRTRDAGHTWTRIGFENSQHIARVRLDPRDPDRMLVAVFGHVFGPHPERGIYRTTDGGANWQRTLFRDDSTGAMDLALDAHDPRVVYATMWDMQRSSWHLKSGGAGSGLFQSRDGGGTWTEITRRPGLPQGVVGKIGVAPSPARAGRVWAVIEAADGGLFRSDDSGATWTRVSTHFELRRRPWYFSHVVADPVDSNTVYYLGIPMLRSRDGGRTFETVETPHPDHQDLWISPDDPNRMAVADDGGTQVTRDGGRSWTSTALATGQFYHVHATNDFPYRVCGAQQDWGAVCGPSRADGGIRNGDWQDAGGGESGWVLSHRDSAFIVWAGDVMGGLTRTDLRTGRREDVSVWPDYAFGHATSDQRERFTYTFPIWTSPHDSNVLYAGSQRVHRSRDGGRSWTPISGDLTRNDPATQGPSAGPISFEHTGPEMFSTIFAGAESPLVRGLIWTGSDDGLVHVTRDGGRTWTNVTPPDAPRWLRISSVEPSHHDPGTAYVAGNLYQRDDLRAYLYKTTDYGRTWTAITNGIPATEFTRALREDPVRSGLLYACTERGVQVSFNDGEAWLPLAAGLPPVPVHDLVVKGTDLAIATHGRGLWVLDDVGSLRQYTGDPVPGAPSVPYLFRPTATTRATFSNSGSLRTAPDDGAVGGVALAANPPSGAVVDYALGAAADSLRLEFVDERGALVRTFTADSTAKLPRGPGVHRFVWDLRTAPAYGFPGMNTWSGDTPGPQVLPGRYTVRLVVGHASFAQPLTIERDPRSHATARQDAEKFAFLSRVVARVSEANHAVASIRDLRAQITARTNDVPAAARARYDAAAAPLLDSLTVCEEHLYQTRGRGQPVRLNDKLAHLADVADPSDGAPTPQTLAVYDVLARELTGVLASRDRCFARLAPLNEILTRSGAPAIVATPAPPGR